MRIRSYIGKSISLIRAAEFGCDYNLAEGRLEVFLPEPGQYEDWDRAGPVYHRFSLQFTLNDTEITSIRRFAHSYMGGKRTGSDHFRVFYRQNLECQSDYILSTITCSPSTARQDRIRYEEAKRKEAEREHAEAEREEQKRKQAAIAEKRMRPRTPMGRIRRAVERGRSDGNEGVAGLVKAALVNGIAPKDIYTNGLNAGRRAVLRAFRKGDLNAIEVLIMRRAYRAGMDALSEAGFHSERRAKYTVILAIVMRLCSERSGRSVAGRLEDEGIDIIEAEDASLNAVAELLNAHPTASVLIWVALSAFPMDAVSLAQNLRKAGHQNPVLIGGAGVTAETDLEGMEKTAIFTDPLSAAEFVKRSGQLR